MHTRTLIDAAKAGEMLRAGEYQFTAPLNLIDVKGLTFDGPTLLRATNRVSGPLISIKSTLPGDVTTGLPIRTVFQNFRVVGNGIEQLQYGLLVDGAMMRFIDVEVINCYLGLALAFSVDNAFVDCLFSRNSCNIYMPGRGGWSVTTTHFNGCNIREAESTGALIQCGAGITFNQSIIESNKGIGLAVSPNSGCIVKTVKVRDSWFENNPTHIVDPHGLVSLDNTFMETV